MAESKLSHADQQHLITLLLDGICERKSARDLHAIANAFTETLGLTLHYNTITPYINKAKDIFNSPYEKTREKMKHNAINRLDALYKRCVDNKDYSTALKIEKELTLLRGVYKDLDKNEEERVINIVFKDADKSDINDK